MADELFTLSIPFPQGHSWLNLNDRPRHWATHNRIKKAWQEYTHYAWLQQGRPRGMPPCAIRSTLIFNRESRRDPHNFIATLKPIIDQLVIDGVWPDDHAGWLELAEPKLVVSKTSPRGVILKAYPRSGDR